MMNDMMPAIEETIDMNDIAHEHEHGCAVRARNAGPLSKPRTKPSTVCHHIHRVGAAHHRPKRSVRRRYLQVTYGLARWPWRSRPYYIAMIKLGMEVMNLDGYLGVVAASPRNGKWLVVDGNKSFRVREVANMIVRSKTICWKRRQPRLCEVAGSASFKINPARGFFLPYFGILF